jgi:acyl-CoA dehydrogenase
MTTLTLGDDWPELRESVERICVSFPDPYWQKCDEDRAYPQDFISALTASGFLACLIPTKFGGAGLPLRAAAVIVETIHRTGCSAAACHAQMYTMGTLLRHGTEEQKARYLPDIANGKLRLQAFGITEPTSGSDTSKISTKAVRHGSSYLISGQKIWTSRALYSDLMLILARTTLIEECTKRTDGLSVFLADLRAQPKGIEIRPLKTMINHNTTEVFFDDFEIQAENLIGIEGNGFYHILDGMNAERILLSSEALGDGRYFIERASEYACQREVFGRSIGENQAIQFPLAQAYANLEAADLMARKAALLFDQNQPCGGEANIAKLLSSEAAWAAGEACFQTFGGYAFASEYGIERKWRECRLFRTAPISTNMVLGFIATHILGLPKSY